MDIYDYPVPKQLPELAMRCEGQFLLHRKIMLEVGNHVCRDSRQSRLRVRFDRVQFLAKAQRCEITMREGHLLTEILERKLQEKSLLRRAHSQ